MSPSDKLIIMVYRMVIQTDISIQIFLQTLFRSSCRGGSREILTQSHLTTFPSTDTRLKPFDRDAVAPIATRILFLPAQTFFALHAELLFRPECLQEGAHQR